MITINLFTQLISLVFIFYRKGNLLATVLSIGFIILASFIMYVLKISVLKETIFNFLLFCVLLNFTKVPKTERIYTISYVFLLCSLRYSVHGFYIINSIASIYEISIASIIQIIFVLFYLFEKKNVSNNNALCFIRYIIAGATFILVAAKAETSMTFYLVVSAIFCFIILCFAYLFPQKEIQKTKIKEMKEKEEILTLARDQYQITLEQAEKYAKQKHDFIHHLSMLDTLLEEDNYTQARQYLSDITHQIQIRTITNYSTNIYVNALLQNKTNIYSDILFDIEMHISKDASAEMIDFCLLLSQLIDYAIKCIYEEHLNKKIKIQSIEKDHTIILEIITQAFTKHTKESNIDTMLMLVRKHNGTLQEIIDTNYHIQLSFTL